MILLPLLSGLSWAVAAEGDIIYQLGDTTVYVAQEGELNGDFALVAVPLASIDSSYGVGTSNIAIFGPVAAKLP